MSIKMKHSVIKFFVWLSAAIIFALVFLSKGTIQEWGENEFKAIMVAVLLLLALGSNFILGYIRRNKKDETVQDERDERISYKSTSFAAVFTFIYIFIAAISLYTRYEDAGVLPVAWLWFIAYSLVISANLSGTLASVIYYWKSERE